MTTAEAYAVCRTIAQREAKNFYYSFRVLPEPKRNAMCAVYAFMRRADDISDDESLPVAERREVMSRWLEAWRGARQSGVSDDPVFLALNDTQKRFAIPDALLEDLVRGTTMDLEPQAQTMNEMQAFATFDDLYRYCYLVASVVGLVCIRIFGYTDSRAEKLAEETGVAFQLTNILRDVKEDAERGRVYLPLDLLHEFGVGVERVKMLASGAAMETNERAMLRALASKAEGYYASADRLLPLIDADSRAALWVLVTIYHDLLRKIAKTDGDVFTDRVSVSTAAKLTVLARGVLIMVRDRMVAS
ncbi:MAG: phytoene/squalene synthase family protein [Edaphobacter sp.]